MKKVPIAQAVGLPLGHDITEIDPQRRIKRRALRRGHVVAAEDLELLLRLGKKTVYVQDPEPGEVHEDEAALQAAPLIAGANVEHDAEPCEGKIAFRAACPGLFLVDPQRLFRLNDLAVPSLPTLPTHSPVGRGQQVAAFRIIPLTCTPQLMAAVRSLLEQPLLEVRPYALRRAGILVTGDEVASGRIADGFIPRLSGILAGFGAQAVWTRIAPDDPRLIAEAAREAAAACQILLVTGGTSVDADDVTAQGLVQAGVKWEVKGIPVQPGNHFGLGWLGQVPVCAVPAAALHHRVTALDLILPRLLARVPVTREQLVRLGHGGLAQPTADEHFPDSAFGTGR